MIEARHSYLILPVGLLDPWSLRSIETQEIESQEIHSGYGAVWKPDGRILTLYLVRVNVGCNLAGDNDYSENRVYLVAKPGYIMYTLANVGLDQVTISKSITNMDDVISPTIHS
jgi:hypothetical protein